MFPREIEFYLKRAKTFAARVKGAIYPRTIELNCEYASSAEPVEFKDRLALAYAPIRKGEIWGRDWSSAWFHVTGTVPEEFQGAELSLLMNIGGEALIFDADGTPVYGLTGGTVYSSDYYKNNYPLKKIKPGTKLDFWIEGAANSLFGLLHEETREISFDHPRKSFTGTLINCDLAVFDREVWNLYLDLEVLISLVEGLPQGDFRIILTTFKGCPHFSSNHARVFPGAIPTTVCSGVSSPFTSFNTSS